MKTGIKRIFSNTCRHRPVNSLLFPGALLDGSPLSVWLSDEMSLLVNYLCCCYFSRQASSSSCPPFLNHLTSMPPRLFPAFSLHLNTDVLLIWCSYRFPCLISHGHIFHCTLIYQGHVISHVHVHVWRTIYSKKKKQSYQVRCFSVIINAKVQAIFSLTADSDKG